MARILIFGAHIGDPFLAAGGTLAKHILRGDKVTIACLTYGERSHAFAVERGLSMEAIKRIKREEAERAAEIIGAEIRYLGYEECPLRIDDTKLQALVGIIREVSPDTVITHWIKDWANPDHATTGKKTLEACLYARVRGFATGDAETNDITYTVKNIFQFTVVPSRIAPEIGFVPDCFTDITDVIDIKIRALLALKSQERPNLDIANYEKHISFAAGSRAKIKYAEAFKISGIGPKSIKYLCTD